jgi:hypothetical protein
MGLSGASIGTYRPQYRPLSAIRYLDVNPLSTRYTLFITLDTLRTWVRSTAVRFAWQSPKEGKGGRGVDIHHHPTTPASSGAAATASSSRAL